MNNLLDKVNKMGAESVTPEEFKETWGVTQETEGASIRQVMSHTGWSYRKVREAGGNAADKS